MVTPSSAEHSEPALRAQDLWFAYRGAEPVLRGVSLTVPAGSVTMVLGRSGSGKTTLLRIAAGLLTPSKGQVEMAGRRPGATAYIPQTLGLVRSMRVLDNVLAGALGVTPTLPSLAKRFPPTTVGEAEALLQELGIADKAQTPVFRLSGGERQRVAIARALLPGPRLVLADEFVSQLDPATADEILERMRTLAGRGTAFLVTTHETDVVERFANQVLVMRYGQLRQAPSGPGTAETLRALLG